MIFRHVVIEIWLELCGVQSMQIIKKLFIKYIPWGLRGRTPRSMVALRSDQGVAVTMCHLVACDQFYTMKIMNPWFQIDIEEQLEITDFKGQEVGLLNVS